MAQNTKSLLTNLSVSLLLLASSGFFGWKFYTELNQEVENLDGIEVGKVAVVQGQAERRFQRQTRWGGVRGEEPIYNLDAIRTSTDSGAVIEILYINEAGAEKRDEIVLGPDTYIVLDLLGKTRNIRFVGGDLSASGSEGLTVSAGDTVVSVDSGSVNLGRKEGVETSVTVIQGEARVNTGAGETLVDPRSSLRVDENTRTTSREIVAVTPLEPGANALLLSYNDTRNVRFAWNLLADWNDPVLEISSDSRFSETRGDLVRIPADGAAERSLGPGRWYWRVVNGGTDSAGPVSLFTVDTERRAEPSSPGAGTIIPFRGSPPPVNLQWTRSYFADSYTVELGRGATITEPFLVREVSGGSLLTEGLDEGTWWWRVIPRYRRAVLDQPSPSEPRSFTLEGRTGHEATRLISPSDGLSFSGLDVRNGVPFTWRTGNDIISYTVSVSRNPDFTDIAATAENGEGEAVLLPAPTPATYYWRVEAQSVDGLPVPVSETRRFAVRAVIGSVELLDPAPGETKELKPYTSHEFRWRSDLPGTQRFILQRVPESGIGDRVKIIESLVNGESFTAPLPGEGSYAWRIQVLDSAGRSLVESGEGRFRLRSEFGPPLLSRPEPGSTVSLVGATNLSLGWNPSPGADAYRVVLRGPDGQIVARDDRIVNLNRDFSLENSGTAGFYSVELTSLRDNPPEGASRESSTATYRFEVGSLVRYTAAVPRSPAAGAVFRAEDAIINGVNLRWDQNPPLGRYTVEVSNNGETRLYQTTEPQLTLRGLDAGTYRWLVQSRDRFGQEAPSSTSSEFRISALPSPGRPTVVFPASGSNVDMTRKNNLEFRWQNVAGAEFYDLALYVEGAATPFWRDNGRTGTSFTLNDLSILDVGNFVFTIQARTVFEEVNEVRTSPVVRVPFSLSVNIATEGPRILTDELQYAE